MTPENPIVGGTTLVRPAIQSPNYVLNTSGWSINQDGSAQFNNLTVTGGNVIVAGADGGIFIYSGTPAAGNLIFSIVGQNGTDPYGNAYPAGITSFVPGTSEASYLEMTSGALSWIRGFAQNPEIALDPLRAQLFITAPGTIVGVNATMTFIGVQTGVPSTINVNVPITRDASWTNLTPQNGWSNAGAPNPPWGVRLMPDGTVAFRGTLSGGTRTDGTQLGTLPAGYFNSSFQAFAPIGYSAAVAGPRITVDTSGNITVAGISGAPGFIQFDGLRLPVI